MEDRERAIAGEERELDRLLELAVSMDLDQATVDRQVRRRNAELALLRQQYREREKALYQERLDMDEVVAQLSRFAQAALGTDVPTRRELLHCVFAALYVREGDIVGTAPREWCRPYFVALTAVPSCALDWIRTSTP